MIQGFFVFLQRFPRYNETNDKSGIWEISKTIINEIQMKQLEKIKML